MKNGVQLRLDLQWKNRRVDPVEGVFQEIHIIGIYEGRGKQRSIRADGSHYMR